MWVSWVARSFNTVADWLAGEASADASRAWGWVRTGPLGDRQLIGWSDGTAGSGTGAGGWILASRGRSGRDITLEAVGGNNCGPANSMIAETFAFLGLTEGLRLQVAGELAPRYWSNCPESRWTEAYARPLRALRTPRSGTYASNIIEV